MNQKKIRQSSNRPGQLKKGGSGQQTRGNQSRSQPQGSANSNVPDYYQNGYQQKNGFAPRPAKQAADPNSVNKSPYRNTYYSSKGSSPELKTPKNRKKKRSLVKWIVSLVLVGFTAFGIYYATVLAAVAPYENTFYPNIYINGIDLGGKTFEEGQRLIQENAQNYFQNFSLRLIYQGDEKISPFTQEISPNHLNVVVQNQQLDERLEEAWLIGRQGNAFDKKKVLEEAFQTPSHFSAVSTSTDTSYISNLLYQMQEAIQREPVDATVTFTPQAAEPFYYTNEQLGRSLNRLPLEEEIVRRIENIQSGDIHIEDYIRIAQPQVTRAQLEEKRQLRASYETEIYMMTRSEDKKQESINRRENIRLSLEAISMELLPGKTFSFNGATGLRDASKGYQQAPEYIYGELISDETTIGGGVCQTSSTLHMAAVQAGLEIGKRYYHSGHVSYMPKGKDATVYYIRGHERDFTFKNTSGESIYIVGKNLDGPGRHATCRIEIYGASMQGHSFDIYTDIIEIEPPMEITEEKNKNLYVGEEKFIEAKIGYEVLRTLVEFDAFGNEVSRTPLSTDYHKPKGAVLQIGTKQVETTES